MHRFSLFQNVHHWIGHVHLIHYVNGVQEHLNLLDKYFKNELDNVLKHKISNLNRILKFVLFVEDRFLSNKNHCSSSEKQNVIMNVY
jgi:hypothetical protein